MIDNNCIKIYYLRLIILSLNRHDDYVLHLAYNFEDQFIIQNETFDTSY